MSEILYSCRATGFDVGRTGESGVEDTSTVWLSASDDRNESLATELVMFGGGDALSGLGDMGVGGGFFWESSPFPIGAEASLLLCR